MKYIIGIFRDMKIQDIHKIVADKIFTFSDDYLYKTESLILNKEQIKRKKEIEKLNNVHIDIVDDLDFLCADDQIILYDSLSKIYSIIVSKGVKYENIFWIHANFNFNFMTSENSHIFLKCMDSLNVKYEYPINYEKLSNIGIQIISETNTLPEVFQETINGIKVYVILLYMVSHDLHFYDICLESAKKSFLCWMKRLGYKQYSHIPCIYERLIGDDFGVDYQTDMHEYKYNLLFFLDKFADIPYFADSGTLLGAIRHGGIIPWDTDIDLGMEQKYLPLLLERCRKYSFLPKIRVSKEDMFKNVYILTEKILNEIDFSINTIEVFGIEINIYMEDDDYKFEDLGLTGGYVRLYEAYRLLRDGKCNIPHDWLYPFKRVEFYDTMINVPNKYLEILYRQYGNNCLKFYPKHLSGYSNINEWYEKFECSEEKILHFDAL